MRLSRYNFLLIGLFVIAGVLLTWAAWHGSRLSILFMGFYIVALGVLQQLSSALSGRHARRLEEDTRPLVS